jgi:hypothetical protein
MKAGQRTIADHVRAYRRRIAAAGEQEVLFKLPNETVAVIDELKQRLGLRNRGQVLVQLIQQRGGSHPPVLTQKNESPACRPGFCVS